MHDLLWKNNIIKQAKNWEIITAAWANIALIHTADTVIETCEIVHNQNIKFYNAKRNNSFCANHCNIVYFHWNNIYDPVGIVLPNRFFDLQLEVLVSIIISLKILKYQ